MTKKQAESKRLQNANLMTTKLGIIFVVIYAANTLVYKLWKLMTPEILQQRWLIAILALSVTVSLWLFSRGRGLSPVYYKGIIFLQILMYLAIGGYSIYAERGMSSNSIILFTIPLIIVSLQHNGKAIIATTALAIIVYATAAIKYFRDYPSEGYKVELYGGIMFYASILMLIGAMLWVLVRSKRYAR